MDGELIFKIAIGCWLALLVGFIVLGLPLMIYDKMYIKPVADNSANNYCKTLGFDFYESYSRIGLLSKTPIAIECKYVEQYRQVDFNNQNPLVKVEYK